MLINLNHFNAKQLLPVLPSYAAQRMNITPNQIEDNKYLERMSGKIV